MQRRVAGVIIGIGLAIGAMSGCVPDPATPFITAGTCLDGDAFVPDVRYDGPVDALGNYTVFGTIDGTCGGVGNTVDSVGIIRAATQSDAQTKCQLLRLFSTARVTRLAVPGNIPSAPRDAWACSVT